MEHLPQEVRSASLTCDAGCGAPPCKCHWPDPTPEMLADPVFEAVWQCIKSWDINVPGAYSGYCGATGNHVRAIMDAIAAPAEVLRPYPELLDLRASLKAMLALFDDEGNMIATFEELQDAFNGGFDTLTRTNHLTRSPAPQRMCD